uniref:Uncharacterized protein n=1 Tax=Spongospora subterranea TaxID=70186 RepID=A0A0H5QMR8_9EUKA|eukprot:CRZ03465.1 hypothetical protein [Spongospora subterranea]
MTVFMLIQWMMNIKDRFKMNTIVTLTNVYRLFKKEVVKRPSRLNLIDPEADTFRLVSLEHSRSTKLSDAQSLTSTKSLHTPADSKICGVMNTGPIFKNTPAEACTSERFASSMINIDS